MAVKWDESWSITVNYQEPKIYPKAAITQVKIDGQVVRNGGTITVTKNVVSVEVTVKNVGQADGTLFCSVGGQVKNSWVGRGGVATFVFSIVVPPTGTKVTIMAGHEE